MIKRYSLELGNWLYDNGYIQEEQKDIVRYASEIVCSEFVEILLMIGYGLYTHRIIETFMYLFLFHTLRKYFQGYHAKTILRCLILTISSYVISLIVYQHVAYHILILLLILSVILQLRYVKAHGTILPMMISVILHLLALLADNYILPNAISLLIVIECIVSISLIPEKEDI